MYFKKVMIASFVALLIAMSFPVNTYAKEIDTTQSQGDLTETIENEISTDNQETTGEKADEVGNDVIVLEDTQENETKENAPPKTLVGALNLMEKVDENTEIEEYIEQVDSQWMFFKTTTVNEYWKIKLADDFYTFIPKYGTQEEVIEGMQSGLIKGKTIDGSNPLKSVNDQSSTEEDSKQKVQGRNGPIQVGGSWQVPIFRNATGRAIYCVDGRLDFPTDVDNIQWSNTLDALGGALYYVYSNLYYGYETNYDGAMQGDSIEQQAGTQAAIWYNMAYHRGNPGLDWSTGSGSGAESALNSNGTVGDNMRYLVGKGTQLPDIWVAINGKKNNETALVDSHLENIGGTNYQASDWLEVTGGGTLSFDVPNPLKLQLSDLSVHNSGSHSIAVGGKYRILNPNLSDDGDWGTGTTSNLKVTGLLYAYLGSYDQSLITGTPGDPLSAPNMHVDWHIIEGFYSIRKNVTQNAITAVQHDLTKVKIEMKNNNGYLSAFYLNADGTFPKTNVLPGEYLAQEIEWPSTMTPDKTIKKVVIVPNEETIVTFTNGTANGTGLVIKGITNTTGIPYAPDLTKVQVNVKTLETHFAYNENHYLNADGTISLPKLPDGKYQAKEISVSDDMHMSPSLVTFTIRNGETSEVNFNNILKKSKVRIGKRDINTGWVPKMTYDVGTEILRNTDGTPKVYTWDVINNKHKEVESSTKLDTAGTYYYRLDPTKIIFSGLITDEYGKVETDWIPYGIKHVWVAETGVPETGHIIINRQPKQVTLIAEDTAYVEFLNNINRPGQICFTKNNEDKKFLAVSVKIYSQQPGTSELVYEQTVTTSTINGVGCSTMVQQYNINNQKIRYFYEEETPAEYVHRGIQPVTDDMWNGSIAQVPIENVYKRVGAELWKRLETNMAGETAKGTEIVWKNKNGELLGTLKYEGNGKATILPTIRIDKLGDGKSSYIEETRYSEGAVKEVVKFRVADIDFASIKDGQILKLNTESTAVVNKATRTIIDKVDPDQKRVPGAGLTIVDPETDKVIHKWIVKEDGPEEITGLAKDKTYKVCETLVPVGYKEPKTLCATFKTDKDGNTTTFNLINEYTQLIIHKIGVPEDVNDTLTGAQLPGAHLGIRLVSRPDDVEIGVPGEDTSTNNVETTENNVIEAPTYSYDPTTGTSDITLAFLDAKVGDTVHEFITTNQAQIIKGIPVGFEVEVYEIAPPVGYEIAEAQKVIISGKDDVEVTLIDAETKKLVETGQNVFAFGMVGAFAVLSGFALLYIAREKRMRA